MATGLQLPLRRALVKLLRQNSGVLHFLPAASIQPRGEPTWPFIKLRAPRTSRLRATGVNGAIIRLDIHAFARDREQNGEVVEYAEDHAGRIGGTIEAALRDTWIPLEGGHKARIQISDTQLLEDRSPDAYHWFAQINARVLAA